MVHLSNIPDPELEDEPPPRTLPELCPPQPPNNPVPRSSAVTRAKNITRTVNIFLVVSLHQDLLPLVGKVTNEPSYAQPNFPSTKSPKHE